MPTVRYVVQGCEATAVYQFGACSPSQQSTEEWNVALNGRDHQWSAAVPIASVDVSVVLGHAKVM